MKDNDLRSKLLYQSKNGYDRITEEDRAAMEAYCEDYKIFLDRSKTERECVTTAIELAEKAGFRPWVPNETLKPGDRVYYSNRGRAIMLAVVGRESAAQGVNIAVAHTDAPRLDLKPRPLYEDGEMAYLKTHYYGGILKYQWVATPLVLHGVVVRGDGTAVNVCIGDDPGDPQFVITDLLPHLGKDRAKTSLLEGVPAEKLNVLVGGRPLEGDDGKDRVKVEALRLLHEKYGIVEEDFISAELQAVPAANARDMGFDRSFIGAYGHDDRVCAFAELQAILELDVPRRTAVCIFADKEEIGSEGVSGMQSQALEWFVESLCRADGVSLSDCFSKSFCLSADVLAATDPTFSDAFDKRNSPMCNHGMGLKKYTGSGGKSGASDASAETVAYVRNLLNEKGVVWQMGSMGKVDGGGGGTVAKFMARRNIDTLDAGVPVLSMHAPCEVVAKLDCYMTYKGIKVLFEA